MADFYSHGTFGNIISGTRIQPVSELNALKVELGTLDTFVSQAVKPSLLIGEKETSYKGYLSTVGFGQFAGAISIDVNPIYKMLDKGSLGTKYLHLEEQVHFAATDTGDIVNKIYTGISTYGIGYTPTTTDTNAKEIRRWPRNWYGDNIKS